MTSLMVLEWMFVALGCVLASMCGAPRFAFNFFMLHWCGWVIVALGYVG